MRVHLILGATGTGKTSSATRLARRTGAPVVVLDRFQCFPELAVVSGRPPTAALGLTRRIYLDDRPLVAGELVVADALAALNGVLATLTRTEPLVIVEGGSVSLIEHLWADPPRWLRSSSSEIRGGDPADPGYVRAIRERVSSLVREGELPAEFRRAWLHTEQRSFLASICGYDVLLAWCNEHGVDPGAVRPEPAELAGLVERITAAHLDYARIQTGVLAALRGIQRVS